MAAVKNSELDELEAKFKSDPYYHMVLSGGDRTTIIPVLLAGMKRRPQQPYFEAAIYMFPASNKWVTKGFTPDKKKEYYRYTLAYLQEAVEILQAATAPEPSQEHGNDSPAARQSMLQGQMALAAIETGDLPLAKKISEERLQANTDPNSWNYGNVIHEANTVLGLVALRVNDIEKAKHYLIQSAKTPGSPQLNSFGPSFMLARELLQKSQKETVLEYLDLVSVFWANPNKALPSYKKNAEEKANLLSKWKQEIKDGKIPVDLRWQW